MKVFFFSHNCLHIVFAAEMRTTSDILQTRREFVDSACPVCGHSTGRISPFFFKSEIEAGTKLDEKRRSDLQTAPTNFGAWDTWKASRKLRSLGGTTSGLASKIRGRCLELVPSNVRSELSKIPVGIYDTFEPNAACLSFKGCKVPVIIFHSGLATYLYRMNRSILPLTKIRDTSGATHSFFTPNGVPPEDFELQAIGSALFFLGLRRGSLGPVIALPDQARITAMWLTDSTEDFLLAHEYAHAALEHSRQLQSIELAGTQPDDVYLNLRSREMEYEADEWAQRAIMGDHVGGRDFTGRPLGNLMEDPVLSGPSLALQYFHFLDVIEIEMINRGILARRYPQSTQDARQSGFRYMIHSTHPENLDRFQRVQDYLEQCASWTTRSFISGIASILDSILDSLELRLDQLGYPSRTTSVNPTTSTKNLVSISGSTTYDLNSTTEGIELRQAIESALTEDLQARGNEASDVTLDSNVLMEVASNCQKSGRYREALETYQTVMGSPSSEHYVSAIMGIASCHKELGELVDAERMYEVIIQVIPNSDHGGFAALLLGEMRYYSMDSPQRASEALSIALDSANDSIAAEAAFVLGLIAHRDGELNRAERLYQRALDRGRHETVTTAASKAANNLGRIMQDRGETTNARRLFRDVIRRGDNEEATRTARENLKRRY